MISMIKTSTTHQDKILEKCVCDIFGLSNEINVSTNEVLRSTLSDKLTSLPFKFIKYIPENPLYNFIVNDNTDKKLLVLSELKQTIWYNNCNTEEIKYYILENYDSIINDVLSNIKSIDYIIYVKNTKLTLDIYLFNSNEIKTIFDSKKENITWSRPITKWYKKNTLLMNDEKFCEWTVPEFNNKFIINFTNNLQKFNKKDEQNKMEENNNVIENNRDVVQILEKLKYVEESSYFDDKIMNTLFRNKSETFCDKISEFFIKYFLLIFIFIIYSEIIKIYNLNKY
jgi:hypothetical protein